MKEQKFCKFSVAFKPNLSDVPPMSTNHAVQSTMMSVKMWKNIFPPVRHESLNYSMIRNDGHKCSRKEMSRKRAKPEFRG
jgi:hypothetical protein